MRLRLFIIPILLLCSLIVLPQTGMAKEYTIPIIRVEVNIQPDGTVRITEHRTYSFDGEFSWADYRLPLQGFTSINDISVTENGEAYTNQNTEEPGTFLVNKGEHEIQVKWFYKADDEQRTFSISYTLKGALVAGPEWTEFFWNYLSAEREKETESLHITLQLPAALPSDSLFNWKRGPQNHIILRTTANGYTVTATDINDDEFVQIRSVFPRALFSANALSTTDDNFTLSRAQDDEETYQKEWIKEQAQNTRYAGYAERLLVVIGVLSIISFLFFYRKYGKRHPVSGGTPSETILIPGRLKPAVAGWLLMKRTIGSPQLMATLLDLARRKYFIIKEQAPEKKWLKGEKKIFTVAKTESDNSENNTLTEWEADLATFITEQIESGNNRIDKLFSESSYKASKWFSAWKKKVNAFCKTFGWYDEESYKGVYGNIAVQVFLLIASVVATIWAGPIGVAGIILTALLLAGSAAIIRRTPEGEKTYHQWKAYKEGLKHIENYSVDVEILDRHFIYALAFGLSKDDIQNVFNQCDAPGIIFYWFIFYGNTTPSVADIATTFSTLGATGAAAFPGATGGAGASAGVAGGGAAGGAG